MDAKLRSMIMHFRVMELQSLLSFTGRSKTGRKSELQARCLKLIKIRSLPISRKIKGLYQHIQQVTKENLYLGNMTSSSNASNYNNAPTASSKMLPNNSGYDKGSDSNMLQQGNQFSHGVYKCKTCKLSFKLAKDLRRHIVIHSGQLPYECQYKGCTFKNKRKDNLKRHLLLTHKLSDAKATQMSTQAARFYLAKIGDPTATDIEANRLNGIVICKAIGSKPPRWGKRPEPQLKKRKPRERKVHKTKPSIPSPVISLPSHLCRSGKREKSQACSVRDVNIPSRLSKRSRVVKVNKNKTSETGHEVNSSAQGVDAQAGEQSKVQDENRRTEASVVEDEDSNRENNSFEVNAQNDSGTNQEFEYDKNDLTSEHEECESEAEGNKDDKLEDPLSWKKSPKNLLEYFMLEKLKQTKNDPLSDDESSLADDDDGLPETFDDEECFILPDDHVEEIDADFETNMRQLYLRDVQDVSPFDKNDLLGLLDKKEGEAIGNNDSKESEKKPNQPRTTCQFLKMGKISSKKVPSSNMDDLTYDEVAESTYGDVHVYLGSDSTSMIAGEISEDKSVWAQHWANVLPLDKPIVVFALPKEDSDIYKTDISSSIPPPSHRQIEYPPPENSVQGEVFVFRGNPGEGLSGWIYDKDGDTHLGRVNDHYEILPRHAPLQCYSIGFPGARENYGGNAQLPSSSSELSNIFGFGSTTDEDEEARSQLLETAHNSASVIEWHDKRYGFQSEENLGFGGQ